MSGRDYEGWTLDEVAEWPGASVTFDKTAKHRRAILAFGDATRFVIYPDTPGDACRAIYNHLSDVRRELRTLGAERSERVKSDRPKSERNPGAALRQMPGGEMADVRPDPWEALKALVRKPLIEAPGFYPELTPAQYFAEPCPEMALTNSGITALLSSCPAKFRFGSDRKATAAQDTGSLVHRLALGKGADFIVSPYDDFRKKEAREWKKEQEAIGRIVVNDDAFAQAEQMAAIIRGRIAEACDGAPYQTEVVIAWKRRGRWCRAMLDVWCPDLLLALDVKTCADASDLAIRRAFAKSYGRQDAWYSGGLSRLTGEHGRVQFKFLFIETEAPFLSRPATVTEGMRHGSTMECDRAFEIFDACMSAGEWPGYAPLSVEPATWQVREWTDAEYGEAA